MKREEAFVLLLTAWGAKNHGELERLMWKLEARCWSAQLKAATEYTELCNKRLESAFELLIGLLSKFRDDAPSTADQPGRSGVA